MEWSKGTGTETAMCGLQAQSTSSTLTAPKSTWPTTQCRRTCPTTGNMKRATNLAMMTCRHILRNWQPSARNLCLLSSIYCPRWRRLPLTPFEPVRGLLTPRGGRTTSKYSGWTSWSTPTTNCTWSKSTPTRASSCRARSSAPSSPASSKTPSSKFTLTQAHHGHPVPSTRPLLPQRNALLQEPRRIKQVFLGLWLSSGETVHLWHWRARWKTTTRRRWHIWRWWRWVWPRWLTLILIFYCL